MASLIAAGTISFIWSLIALRLGPRIGFVDRPDGSSLKTHETPAVPLGGVGIYLGLHTAAMIRGELDGHLLAATTIVLLLGITDDRWGLAPVVRLGVEVVAGGVLLMGLTDSWREPIPAIAAVIFVVFACNAVNLFDGLDGLAGSAAIVAALGVAWLASGRGLVAEPALELATAGLGFLVLGWHPARVFLGDSGAYVLGVALAASILDTSPEGGLEFLVASFLLGVFAIDLVVTLIRRLVSHRPLFTGDRSHVYDQLRDRGLSVPAVAAGAALAQAILIVVVNLVEGRLTPGASVVVLASVGVLVLLGLGLGGFLRVDAPG